jgi:hypothetical protein
MFPVTSRYYNIEVATFDLPDGRTVAYLRRRFLPDGTKAVVLAEHTVAQGDRLDNVTARYLGDPNSSGWSAMRTMPCGLMISRLKIKSVSG